MLHACQHKIKIFCFSECGETQDKWKSDCKDKPNSSDGNGGSGTIHQPSTNKRSNGSVKNKKSLAYIYCNRKFLTNRYLNCRVKHHAYAERYKCSYCGYKVYANRI